MNFIGDEKIGTIDAEDPAQVHLFQLILVARQTVQFATGAIGDLLKTLHEGPPVSGAEIANYMIARGWEFSKLGTGEKAQHPEHKFMVLEAPLRGADPDDPVSTAAVAFLSAREQRTPAEIRREVADSVKRAGKIARDQVRRVGTEPPTPALQFQKLIEHVEAEIAEAGGIPEDLLNPPESAEKQCELFGDCGEGGQVEGVAPGECTDDLTGSRPGKPSAEVAEDPARFGELEKGQRFKLVSHATDKVIPEIYRKIEPADKTEGMRRVPSNKDYNAVHAPGFRAGSLCHFDDQCKVVPVDED